MRLWRISEHADLSGHGGELFAARWNHRGDAIVYCSDHPSTALLEILVNADPEDLPETYRLLEIDLPDDLGVETAEPEEGWRDDVSITREFWRGFAAQGRAPVLRVPSVVMPRAVNFLINPRHAASRLIAIASSDRFAFDPRFRR